MSVDAVTVISMEPVKNVTSASSFKVTEAASIALGTHVGAKSAQSTVVLSARITSSNWLTFASHSQF